MTLPRIIILARFNPRIRPVQSLKHIVDQQGGLVAGTKQEIDLITAKDVVTLADTESVQTGSTISAIYLNVQCSASNAVALANVYMTVMKNPGGNLSTSNGNTVGAQDTKKYVIHQDMSMLSGSTDPFPTIVFRGVIRIPRGYKRFGFNDKLQLILYSPGITVDFCVQCIYKEFR